jgi:LPXTG-site transpeptidase (sortase) family protein
MRYHYQRGATKQKKGIGRIKLGIAGLLVVGFAGYGAFLSMLPGLGGWPFKKGDETALRVRSTEPGKEGNRIYIPKINVMAPLANGAAELEGELGPEKTAVVRAEKSSLGLTPQSTLEKSLFSRLNQLSEGDEFFIDFNGTRFAYSVTTSNDARITLESKDKSVSIKAKPIGVVAWNGGSPRIETIN